jgi:hypothetical protein
MRFSSVLIFVLGLAGCTHTYSVKIDGDVQGSDKDTPRAVRADVLEGTEAVSARQWGLGHLRPLPEAEITVSLKMKGEEQPRAADTFKVDSRSAEFSIKKEGEGNLAWVVIKVTAQGRKPVEHAFPSPPDLPFQATLMTVLDELPPAPPAPAPTPK